VPDALDFHSITRSKYTKFTFAGSKGISMASHDYNVDPVKQTGDPRSQQCDCGTSVVLPKHPIVHCPKCHATYRARSLQRPAYCAHCNYHLRLWRQRNAIPDLNTPYL